MTSGPTYGQGFIELEPRLSRDFLANINRQLDRAFSNIQLDIETAPLRDMSRELGLIESAAGRTAGELSDVAREAAESRGDLGLMTRALDQSEDEARLLATRLNQAETESGQLQSSTRLVNRQLEQSADEARKMAREIEKAGDTRGAVARLNTSLGGTRSRLNDLALGAAAFFGARGLAGGAVAARDSFIALEESVNAVNVVFGDGADRIFAFSEQVATSAGLAKSEFQQMSTVLGAALINAGFTADVAADKTVALTQRAADMASVFNTDVADALGAIQAALRGESDPIERFGVSLAAAAVDAEAAALGYKSVAGEFDATARAAARLSLIMEQTDRVGGDFVNTADSLANRQRVLAAETENVRAKLGEALLPIFESLVGAGPELIDALSDMAPALSAIATSAAGFATSTPGVLDFVDALRLLTDVGRGFGQVIDTVSTVPTAVSGVFETLEEISRLDFSHLGDNFEEFSEIGQRTIERVNVQGFVDDLREGEDAAVALSNRLAAVGRNARLSPQFIRQLRDISGLDLEESAVVLQQMVTDSERLGLTADEVALLSVEFANLRNQLGPVGNEVAQATRAMLEVPEVLAPAVVSALDTVRASASEVGLSMGDLVAGVEPAAAAMLATLTPAEQLSLKLEALVTGTATAAEAFAANFQPSLVSVQDGLNDLNENGTVSLEEFTASLDKAATDFLNFMVDIAAIGQISPELASALKALGPEAGGLIADGFANADPQVILDAAADLLGSPEQIGAIMQEIYASGLESVDGTDPAAVQAWLGFVQDTFEADIPGITAIMAEAFQPTIDAAVEGLDPPDMNPVLKSAIAAIRIQDRVGELQAKFTAIFDGMRVDLTAVGREARSTFITGLSTRLSTEVSKVRESIRDTVNNAIQRRSPPKLFMDAGMDSGEAFWDGFEAQGVAAPLTIDVPPQRFREVGTEAGFTFVNALTGEIDGAQAQFDASFQGIRDYLADIVAPDAGQTDFLNDYLSDVSESIRGEVETFGSELAIVLDSFSGQDRSILGEALKSVVAGGTFDDALSGLPEHLRPVGEQVAAQLEQVIAAQTVEADLSNVGVEARSTFVSGLADASSDESGRIRASLLATLDAAIERRSPPRIFMAAGSESGEAFWSGFADVPPSRINLDIPTEPFEASGTVAGGTFVDGVTGEVADAEARLTASLEGLGDVFDRAVVPSGETGLLDDFLSAQMADVAVTVQDAVDLFGSEVVEAVDGFTGSDVLGDALRSMLSGDRLSSDIADVVAGLPANLEPVGNRLASELQQVLDAQSVHFDMSATGTEARDTFVDGFASMSGDESGRLRDSIMGTLDRAIDRHSPPRMFLEAGQDSGAAFWSGFESAALTFPGIDLTPSFDATRAVTLETEPATGGGGPLIGSMTVNNPIGEPTEDSVQAALIEVAISPIVNRLVSAGSSI